MAGPLAELVEGLLQQRRGAGDEQADVLALTRPEAGVGEQPHVEGGHTHEHRRPRQQPAGFRGVEPRAEDHRRAVEERRVARHEQPVGVEDGEHVQERVAFAESPGLVQHLRVREQVGVREHRTLRLAGGARGVEQRGEVAGPALDGVEPVGHRAARLDQGAVVVRAEGERLAGAVPFAQPGDRVQRFRSRHHQSGLGIAEEVVQLRSGYAGLSGRYAAPARRHAR